MLMRRFQVTNERVELLTEKQSQIIEHAVVRAAVSRDARPFVQMRRSQSVVSFIMLGAFA